VIGCHTRNYIKWIGFSVDEQFATPEADTGPVVLHDSTQCWVERLNIVGYQYGHNQGDNHNGIRFQACIDCYAGQNTVSNIYTCPDTTGVCTGIPFAVNLRNGACIMSYASRGVTIEHNDLSACGTGIYLKGEGTQTQYGYTVRYNLVHDLNWGMYVSNFTEVAGAQTNIYQNIVRDCIDRGLTLTGDVSSLYNVAVYNNTIDGCTLNMGIRNAVGGGLSFTNNLVTNPGGVSSSYESFSGGEATAKGAVWSIDYNMYYGQDRWSYNGAAYTTIGTWRTAVSDETHSSVQDPLYVNAGSNNFHLQGGSPALTASNSGGPIGAYIIGNETIGVEPAQFVRVLFPVGSRAAGGMRAQ
jgi:hypothetical protein